MTITPELRDCPFCAEPVRLAAIRCKHCGSDISPTPEARGASVPMCEIPNEVTEFVLDAQCKNAAYARCQHCNRAYCGSHDVQEWQGEGRTRTYPVTCRPCFEDPPRRKKEQDAEWARQVQEREEAQRREQVAAQEAYLALPVMSDDDWVAVLKEGAEPPTGKRPGNIDRLDAVRLIRAAGFKPRRVLVDTKAILGRAWSVHKAGWIVGQSTHEKYIRGDRVTETIWLVLLETGEVRGAIPYKGGLDGYVRGMSGWAPTLEGMMSARRYLEARPLGFSDLH